jgi:DNA repair protein RecO (recombination protein O)
MVNLSVFETKAVIIKTQDFKENDKLVWFYTEKLGKVTAVVRGAKKSKSKFLALTLPLCYGEYMLYKGKNLYTLQEGKIINSFQGLLDNLHKLTYSSYLCELIDIASADNEENGELFKNLITTLYLLNTDALDYELLVRAFELKLLKATGYNLILDNCSICRKKISSSNYISLSYYGGV